MTRADSGQILNYIQASDAFFLICRKGDRVVTISDLNERGMFAMIYEALSCLSADSAEYDALLEIMEEAHEATLH